MKSDNFLTFILTAGIGIGLYFFLKDEKNSIVPRDTVPAYSSYPINSINTNGQVETKIISSTKQGVDFINDTIASGGTLLRTSGTIQKVGYNDNVARLADGSIARVTVKQPVRDKSGKTALDKIIEKNLAKRRV